MGKRKEADRIVTNHVIWSMGGGLIPVPLFDIAAVTAIQLDMLKQLANLYETDFSKSSGKAFVTALTGTTFARIGASMFKVFPGVGTVLGGVSMSVLSGASTYAIGQVAISQLEAGGDLFDLDFDWAREKYEEALERGKEIVEGLEAEPEEAEDVYAALERLGELKEKGIITEEEFEEKKQALLDRI
jgi:uncharacterized protein (DUF697 family)